MRARRPLAVLLACLLPLLAALAAPGRPALAQQPAERSAECAALDADTVPADTPRAVGRHHHGLLLVMIAFVAAPPGLFLFPEIRCNKATSTLGFWDNSASVSVAAGGAFTSSRGRTAYAANLELLARGVYSELRLEEYDPGEVRLRSARVGYLVHPAPSMAGGVTVGYRDAREAPDEWAPAGVEIAFPFMAALCRGDRNCWVRWEPTYVITRERIAFAPRLGAELPIGGTPFAAGLHLEAKGERKPDPLVVTVHFGLRR